MTVVIAGEAVVIVVVGDRGGTLVVGRARRGDNAVGRSDGVLLRPYEVKPDE